MSPKLRTNCIVCQKEIPRRNIKGKVRTLRSNRNITCSKPCAKLYLRISTHLQHKFVRKAQVIIRENKRLNSIVSLDIKQSFVPFKDYKKRLKYIKDCMLRYKR